MPVSASAVAMMAGSLMAAAIMTDREVMDDIMGGMRDCEKGLTGMSYRQHRIKAITDLAWEIAKRIEIEAIE